MTSKITKRTNSMDDNNNHGADIDVDDTVVIYHMCQKKLWEAAVANGDNYIPPTFVEDGGFVHAAQHPEQLLQVANHFYQTKSKNIEWICLQLRPSVLLKEYGIRTVWESPAPVGTTPSFHKGEPTTDGSSSNQDEPKFPHVYGGIPTSSSPTVVANIYPMIRNANGKFISIPGLLDGDEE